LWRTNAGCATAAAPAPAVAQQEQSELSEGQAIVIIMMQRLPIIVHPPLLRSLLFLLGSGPEGSKVDDNELCFGG